MAEYLTNTTDLTKVASAIREKGGTSATLVYPDGFVTAIQAIQTCGGTTPGSPGDITFYDYDGTIVTSWTLEELATKTALPDYPLHEGLTCQGWNWSLADLKTTNRKINVGAMYITDDGATRLHIRIATVGRMTVPLYIGQTVANGVSIDWGDGSTVETLAGTGNVNTSHTYAEPGDYVISLMPQDGCTLSFGNGSSSYCVMGSTGNNGKVYCNMLQEIYIGDGVTSIGSSAFASCSSLASITIPDGVTSINNSAFARCSSLASITIPDGVTSINNSTFSSCSSLASITIPDWVTSIGGSAFASCSSLASITIPDGVTSIGSYAFANCSSLASITIPDGVTSINNSAFANCSSLASITIPDGVTSINNSTFSGCSSLASITIPDGVTSINNSAFANCSSLASITIPDGVTSINNSAFANCSSLASITIPDGVTSIGSSAFASCYGMRYYDFSECTSVPALSNTNAFNNLPSDCQIRVPAALVDAWKAATNWSTYADHIVGV